MKDCTGFAPGLAHRAQPALQFWSFLSELDNTQHQGLVASEHLLHLLIRVMSQI